MDLKKCVLYVRVSSEKQVDGYSLDSQTDLCTKKALDMGYQVVRIFREEGVSAKTVIRPELQDLLTYCTDRTNNISAVLVYSFSRLNRNTVDFLTLRHLFSKHGISLISVTEPSGDSPEQRFIETILAAKDEYENLARARNVSNSLKKRFFEGHITSKPPIGYLMQKVNGKSIAIKHPELFKIMKNFWYRIDKELLSLHDVTKELNKLGISYKHNRRHKRFLPQTISKIFANKFYAGILVSSKYGETQGLHEPMVDLDLFWRVRSIIHSKNPNDKQRYNLRKDFMIRGLLKCEYCGKKLSSAWSKGKNARYPYYCCQSRGLHHVKSYPRDDVEQKFIELLRSIKVDKDFMIFFAKILKEKYQSRLNQLHISKKTVLKDIEILESSKTLINQKNLKGVYSDEECVAMKEDVDNQIMIKMGLINEKRLDILDIDTILEFMIHYLSNIDKLFLKASPEGRMKIGCSIFPNGLIFENGAYRTPEIAYSYKLTREFATMGIKMGEA